MHQYLFRHTTIEQLTEQAIVRELPVALYVDSATGKDIAASELQLNHGVFSKPGGTIPFPVISVLQEDHQLALGCTCTTASGQLCAAMAEVLIALLRNEDYLLFFHTPLRLRRLKEIAAGYGLEHTPQLDEYFDTVYQGKVIFRPRLEGLLPVNATMIHRLKELMAPKAYSPAHKTDTAVKKTVIVFRQHKFYKYLVTELYQAATSRDGKLKNPLSPVSPLDRLWTTDQAADIKFFTAVYRLQQYTDGKYTDADQAAIRAIVSNPIGYDCYLHDPEISENITAGSVRRVRLAPFRGAFRLEVSRREPFYEIKGHMEQRGIVYALADIRVQFDHFLLAGDTLYLPDQPELTGLVAFLQQHKGRLLVHNSQFPAFKQQFLDPLSDKIAVAYPDIAPATPAQLKEQGFDGNRQQIIYLSDSGQDVLIIPVLRYNDVEIPVRSKRLIHAQDDQGRPFLVQRDEEAEGNLTSLVLRQHPCFAEQLDNDLYYFYLHRERFLAEEWFLDVFEEWLSRGIMVLGFNDLEGNKLNPHKAKVDIKVMSGINWFNADIAIRFGRKRASLQQVYKAIRNRSRYVRLDDGTQGILPGEWIDKFTAYFNSGEIVDENTLHIPKVNFADVARDYDEPALSEEVRQEIGWYERQLGRAERIKDIGAPEGLQATLRGYQQLGLNWLNYLDDLNFGGCLADDMGLGKSIQIIAFILSQRTKVAQNTNLLVVPATLIGTWKEQVAQFAPSLKIYTLYGPDRATHTRDFDHYELILTSYGSLPSDIGFLGRYMFNYVFLDESQNIKNPGTQRYKTVRQLQARNRIAITGTPVENNTFDLYSQLSFACPGLLGSKQYFRDIYATPIDTFKISKRAQELQQKIKPFVLRRTKEQVAPELPDKTEIVLYCDMEAEQRCIYNTYEKQFREYISATTSDELKKSPMHILKGLTKLRQICNSPKLLGHEDLSGEHSAKMDVLMEQIMSRSPQHKILVFSQFVSMLELIGTALTQQGIGHVTLTGRTRKRQEVIDTFRNDPGIRVFLISLKAGGTGLNLTEADYVYLVDPWWNPAVEQQAIDRVHRIGQQKKVIAVRLICTNTIEEKIRKMQESKRVLSEGLIHTEDVAAPSLNKEELLQLLEQ